MIFLTGATVPMEPMPDTMRRYAVDALRWAWLDRDGDSLGLGVLGGTLAICAAISAWLFRWE
jgi:hypothetical protein